ncbi:unnamed protein product [Angiostrongylus costaricensis]|uniref:Solute carrier organic anion transporter family member n=1 Tax=Angiostrongylus costaricensis TaxID=334426 RepID=A0A158PER3_ANGCS|nr:unnamed protein product [Angiostrongylus costaricensis]
MGRMHIFLGLLSVVYFFEAIGGSYLISAIQNIERQFQIPSKISGLMVSASDLGYIPTVIFVAYFGSRGNRAKWIGSGALLAAFTYLAIASPNFIYPVAVPQANTSEIQMSDSVTNWTTHNDNAEYAYYSIDGDLLNEAMNLVPGTLAGNISTTELRQFFSLFVRRRSDKASSDLFRIRRSAVAPFTYCGQLVNEFRRIMTNLRCSDNSGNKSLLFILLPALFFLGIGRTMPWSLGIPLVDDNVKRKSLPAYFAGMSFVRVLGPISGFLLGSFCNKLYYTLHPPVGITPSDPAWIGAWWIGFIFIGVITIFPSVALFFFPVEFKSGSGGRKKRINLFDKCKDNKEDKSCLREKAIDFLHSYAKLFRTKIYVGSVLGRICDVLAFKAMFGVFGFALGTIIGGFATHRYRLNGRRAAMFVLVVSTVNMGLFFLKAFIACESVVNSVGLNGRDNNYNFTHVCNSDCGCADARLYPVCDIKGYAFFSPCHAGCREVKVDRDESDYMASQISFVHNVELFGYGGMVRKDFCKHTCTIPTIIFFSLVLNGALFAGMGVVPGLLILLRSVPTDTRSQSLGLQGLLVSLFGTLPSPVLWGYLIDSACLVWETSCTSDRGNCVIYEAHTLRMRMHVMYTIIRIVSMFTDIYVWYHAQKLNIIDVDEIERDDSAASQLII